MKKLIPTKAKLPKDEHIIGGDANPKFFNNRKKEIKLLEKALKISKISKK